MRLVPMKQGVASALALCGKGARGGLELRTFKKDRGVRIVAADGAVRLSEDGFATESRELPSGSEAKRAVRAAVAREFPRSNKLYVQEVS